MVDGWSARAGHRPRYAHPVTSRRAALAALAVASALAPVARAQDDMAGVVVRALDGELVCGAGDASTVRDATCDALTCPPGRVCVSFGSRIARCIDPAFEIVCVKGSGCDCPLDGRGADPEACRVVALQGEEHSLCFYHPGLVCLASATFRFDPAACLPPTFDEPSIRLGDCDRDGVPNQEDACLCEDDTAPTCAPMPLDAGVAAPDAGTDADGGGAIDAASSIDAGSPAAPPGGTNGPRFGGGGGCVCEASGARRGVPAGIAAGLALLIGAARRRRGERRPTPRARRAAIAARLAHAKLAR